jgi:hypothetical protein
MPENRADAPMLRYKAALAPLERPVLMSRANDGFKFRGKFFGTA